MNFATSGTDGFGLIFDNLLQYDLPTIRRLTNLYGLLYSSLLTNDSWWMTNRSLQQMLSEGDGSELIREGILVPTRRDTVDSFDTFRSQCEAKNMHGFCATADFGRLLDEVSRGYVMDFPMSEVGANYGRMSKEVLQPDFLQRLGVDEADAIAVGKMVADADAKGVKIDNTYIVDVICPELTQPSSTELVGIAARSPYNLNLPSVLGTGVVGPEGFRGAEIMAALRGEQRTTAILETGYTSGAPQAAFSSLLDDPQVHWMLSSDVLTSMSAAELAQARSTSNRADYLARLAEFLASPSQMSWDQLIPSLSRYLSEAAQGLFRARAAADNVGEEPAQDASVGVEGDANLRVLTPEKPVELSGVSEEEEVYIIGKTLQVPEPDPQSMK